MNKKLKKYFLETLNCTLQLNFFENSAELEKSIEKTKKIDTKPLVVCMDKIFFKVVTKQYKRYSLNSQAIIKKIQKPLILQLVKLILLVKKY